ncbi:MAG: acyl-CoA dehydrogenase family protein [Burkholderiales bacterium]|jgi:acyl-CoA dehydrogenase
MTVTDTAVERRARLPAAELDALCARVRAFIDEVAIPREDWSRGHDVAWLDAITRELRAEARRRGLLAPQLPVEAGGLGLCWQDCARVFEECGRSVLGAGALGCQAPDQPNIDTLMKLAAPSQRERWLAPLMAGEIRSAFAMTEPAPGVGSDPRMLSTRARRDGDGWVLDGHKWFASGALGAAFAIVVARAEEGASWFIVDTANPGWRFVRDIPSIDSFAPGGHGEVRLEHCRLPADALIGEAGRGFDYAQLRLEGARLFHCMRGIGLASRSIELATEYAAKRDSFGARLSEHQQIQAMVADSHIDLYASRLMTADVARRLDEGESIRHHSSMAKVFVSEALNRVADRACQMTGALGMCTDHPIAMIAQRLRPFRIYDGASEVHRAAIGKRVFQRGSRA